MPELQLKEFDITDLGFASPDGYDLPEIWGLDNRGDQRFYHKGFTGHPDLSDAVVYSSTELVGKLIVLFTGYIVGGTARDAADVLNIFVNEYGLPDDSYIDKDGRVCTPLPHER